MKLLLLSSILLLSSACFAREVAVDEAAHARYASGEVMAEIMAQKEATWQHYRDLGYFKPGRYKSSNGFYPCVDGSVTVGDGANSTLQCLNLDVTGYLTHEDLGSTNPVLDRIGSSIWGITLEGREFAIIGQADGAAFAEVVGKGWWNWVPYYGKSEGTLDYIGRLPQHSVPIIWREIKTYKHYAIIGSEAVGHGIQIFDLRKLLEIRPWWNPLSTATKTFDIISDVTGHFDKLPVGRSHNVVIAEASQHIIAVGAQPRNDTCRSGLIFIDVSDPSNPTQTGCAASDGYVHDAQCLIYRGPDTRYNGVEICYGYNEDSLTIYNITDKADAKIISRISYEGASYTHQGWVLDPENQEFLLMDDELDEQKKAGSAADQKATTYIWNIANLEKPILTGVYKSDVVSIDHNQYIDKGFSYQSNYGAGLRILDVQGIPSDPTGGNIQEVAFIDIFPDDDAAPAATFMGTWGSYGFFKSGHIIINTYDRGVFVVKRSKEIVGGFRAEF